MKIKEKRSRLAFFETEDPDVLQSSPVMSNRNAVYIAHINTKELTYKIKNIKQRKIIKSTEKTETNKISSVTYLKRLVKKRLKELGVEFETEIKKGLYRERSKSSTPTD